mmetsp:Transcript_2229/g.8219  ORF Transcript_2229/g.8219 Transcript_2229/m.8219 type:complete len:121 (-) Transcript_2229:4000-4362(-)
MLLILNCSIFYFQSSKTPRAMITISHSSYSDNFRILAISLKGGRLSLSESQHARKTQLKNWYSSPNSSTFGRKLGSIAVRPCTPSIENPLAAFIPGKGHIRSNSTSIERMPNEKISTPSP